MMIKWKTEQNRWMGRKNVTSYLPPLYQFIPLSYRHFNVSPLCTPYDARSISDSNKNDRKKKKLLLQHKIRIDAKLV